MTDKEFLIETDELPVCIQKYMIRSIRFQYMVTHIPCLDLKIANALSQAPLPEITQTDKQLQQDADAYVT